MGLIGAFQTVKPETIKEEITTSGTWTAPDGVNLTAREGVSIC